MPSFLIHFFHFWHIVHLHFPRSQHNVTWFCFFDTWASKCLLRGYLSSFDSLAHFLAFRLVQLSHRKVFAGVANVGCRLCVKAKRQTARNSCLVTTAIALKRFFAPIFHTSFSCQRWNVKSAVNEK